jgi:serine/threonine protein kinase
VARDTEEETMATAPSPGAKAIVSGEADPDDMLPGSLIGEYVVEKTVAAGGGGIVFQARHKSREGKVAIKVLRAEVASSTEGLVRFQREARVVNMIRHPAIVEIYEFGQLRDGRPYFVMDLLEGQDLKQLIVQRGRLPLNEAVDIVCEVCSALEAAHGAGVVHRDLKASNIHATLAEGRYRIKLLDFGIAKLLSNEPGVPGLTQRGTFLGTASAMAPEQIRGLQIDERTDVYAVGVLLYHTLTGRYPFRAKTRQEVERMNLMTPPPRPSDAAPVPPAVDEIVIKCMSKRADGRFPSAAAVAAALREAVAPKVAAETAGPKQAVAVHVDLSAESAEADDDVLEEIAEALDLAEQRLREAAFVVSLHTSTTLLAARLLPDDPGEARADRKKALDEAVSLAKLLSARDADVALHVDTALVRGNETTPQIAGPVVEFASWPAMAEWNGIRATPAGTNDLE